ncbi:hypothetical protein ABIA00_003235 [Bradyrhizobium ottawaense]
MAVRNGGLQTFAALAAAMCSRHVGSYCKDQRRRGEYPNVVFDFLGYQFRPRRVESTQRDEFFCGYACGQPNGMN